MRLSMENFATALCILLTVYGVQARMTIFEASRVASSMALLEKRGYNFMNSSVQLRTRIDSYTTAAETLGNTTLSSMNSTLFGSITSLSANLTTLESSSWADASSCIPSLTNASATATEIVANATTCWNALITKLVTVNTASVATATSFLSAWDSPMVALYTCYTADATSDVSCLLDLQDEFDDVLDVWYKVAALTNATFASYLEFLVGVPSCNYAAEIATLKTNMTAMYTEAESCATALGDA